MNMADAIKIIETLGGMARQPARSTALAVWVNRADANVFGRAVASIRATGIKVIVCKSREMFEGE